jgi:hypothetical protein
MMAGQTTLAMAPKISKPMMMSQVVLVSKLFKPYPPAYIGLLSRSFYTTSHRQAIGGEAGAHRNL